MKLFELLRLQGVAQGLLGLLGILLAVSVGLAVLDGGAMFAFTHASRDSAAAVDVAVANATSNDAAVRSSGGGIGVDVNPEPGAFLLVGSGIAGFVYLAMRRRKAGVWSGRFGGGRLPTEPYEPGEQADLALRTQSVRK